MLWMLQWAISRQAEEILKLQRLSLTGVEYKFMILEKVRYQWYMI
jgi:hypothetical protein